MEAKSQLCSNQIRAINDRVIMRLQCTYHVTTHYYHDTKKSQTSKLPKIKSNFSLTFPGHSSRSTFVEPAELALCSSGGRDRTIFVKLALKGVTIYTITQEKCLKEEIYFINFIYYICWSWLMMTV